MDMHTTLVSALIAYDARESKKPSYNRYALPQYLLALANAEALVRGGSPLRRAITQCFLGRLADRLLVAIGEPKMSREELRGW